MNGAPTELPPPQWRPLARLVIFLLGIATIIDGLVGVEPHVGELVVGLVLIGLVPVDEFIAAMARRISKRSQ